MLWQKLLSVFTKSLFLKYQLLILLVQVTRPLQDRPMRYQKAINRRDSRIFYGLWYGKRATRENWLDRPYESYDVDETHSS